jgi:hypothetical protein
MKARITVLLISGLLAGGSIVAAQTTPDQKKLDVMVGKWNIEVDTKATPVDAGQQGIRHRRVSVVCQPTRRVSR